jgi:hypothetical protein
MTTNNQENRTKGSCEIPDRRGNGIAGPSRAVSGTDAAASGTDRAGHENNVDEYDEEDRPLNLVRDVIRKTELIGWDVWPAHHKRRKIPVEPDEGTDTPEEE